MITLKTKIGDSVLEIQGSGDKELIEKASFWSEVARRKTCDCCNGTDLVLSFRTPKSYKYYGLKCNTCGAALNFGQKQEDGSLFLKWDAKFDKFNSQPKQETSQDDGDSSIPF